MFPAANLMQRHKVKTVWVKTSRTHLLPLEESFSVTVGKVKGQGHHARGVLHTLNDPVQLPPTGTLV